SISALTMRPWGPEPRTAPRSIPACAAMRRASGLASVRSCPLVAAGALGAEAGVVLGAGGMGASALALWAARGAGGGGCAGAAAGGAFAAACALGAVCSADLSSPSSRRRAITAFTFTPWAPSWTTISPITPSSTASTSMVALSVSISAMTSPAFTVSPTFLCHLARLPSVMVGDSAGIRISMGIVFPLRSAIGHGFGGVDEVVDLRQRQRLEMGGVGQRHVLVGQARQRRIEPVEGLLHELRGDFRANAGEGPALLHGDDAVGLLHRGHD